tara:strand:- start:663 stop:860 length:198 start_codon:yes stop_codon:yes gene_type:complete
MKFVDKMTFDELESELKELKLGLGGIGTKDIMRMHNLEDEIDFRIENGYADLTPDEIFDELNNEE